MPLGLLALGGLVGALAAQSVWATERLPPCESTALGLVRDAPVECCHLEGPGPLCSDLWEKMDGIVTVKTSSTSRLAARDENPDAAATGTSTAGTAIEEPTEFICSPDTCGSGECPAGEPGNALKKRWPPFPVDRPAPGDWVSPEDYADYTVDSFMRGETYMSSMDPATHVYIPGRGEEVPTAQWIKWADVPARLALTGLFGCTAVVVVSELGAWIAHFWERRDDKALIKAALGSGIGEPYRMEYGLANFINNDAHPLGPEVGNMLNPEYNTRVFLVSSGDNVVGQRVLKELRKRFSFDPEVIPYSKMPRPEAGYGEPPPPPYSDPEFYTSRGKLLLQYKPASMACADPWAWWRLWFQQTEPSGNRVHAWPPHAGQIFGGLARRGGDGEDGGACEVPDKETAAGAGNAETPSDEHLDPLPAPFNPAQEPAPCKVAKDCTADCGEGFQAVCKEEKCGCEKKPGEQPGEQQPTEGEEGLIIPRI